MNNLLKERSECRQTGEEELLYEYASIRVFKSIYGNSYRYQYLVNGEAVSVLQIVAKTKRKGTIREVYTLPEHRRKGYALRLLKTAKCDFDKVLHSSDKTTDGKLWAQGIKYRS